MSYLIIVLIVVIIIESIALIWFISKYKQKKDIQDTINFFRSLWGKFTFYVLATSVIGLFLGSVYLKQEIELNTINNWVSIVLGLVALIIGIISLFLSFYNLDEANKANTQSLEIMQKLQIEFQKQMEDMRQDIKQKIEESNKETQNIVENGYRNSAKNLFEQPQGTNTWEDV